MYNNDAPMPFMLLTKDLNSAELASIAMMLSAIIQFLFVLLACSAHITSCSSNGNYTDKMALLDFKKTISYPQQALINWNESIHFCSWEGVLCSVKHPQRVTSLRLEIQGLAGQISPSLGNLTYLKVLILSANSITGEIPQSLGHLRRLQILKLNNNTLHGRIPSFANCSKLRELWLSSNKLVGQIPSDLPHGLQNLTFSENNLVGTFPASIGNITKLKMFSCVYNSIKGNVPNEFAQLTELQFLFVGSNKLSGSFPQSVLNISNLIRFSAASNGLGGVVPSNVGNSLPNLQVLELGGNFFYGHIPSTITNASKLFELDIPGNQFTGLVPTSIGELSQLSSLNIGSNNLKANNRRGWEFMKSLANCTKLRKFAADGNLLEGNVPNTLGNISGQLHYLYLADNQLSGDFPSGISNLRELILLALEGNHFTGLVPEWLGSLKNLQKVTLNNNLLSGVIPSGFSNMSQLEELYLQSNQFDGNIPQTIGILQMLRVLNISNNNLRGTIPMELFGIPTIMHICLSSNKLNGTLHTDIGNSKQLTYLHISSNNLSGEIPVTLGNCESLEEIVLDHNIFSGSIPISLGNIKTLQNINLSHNILSGPIPVSLGSLQLLEQIDFSFNRLAGKVPTKGIFKNLTAVRIDGNPGLCGGEQELHLLPCSAMFMNSRKHKYSTLKKVVIPLSSIVSVAVAISIMFLWRQKQNTKLPSMHTLFGSKLPKVSYNDLARATEGFSASNLIGTGRYSSVYRGTLFQGRIIVAVKVFNLETRGAQKSFIAECNALINARHRNLVPILTACSSIDSAGNDFKALVYEFMARGDLHMTLYSTRGYGNTDTLGNITLTERLNIVVDVADALEYLHHNNHQTIVHCDLKPRNILLDDNMTAHVGDFGLARFRCDSPASSFGDSISTFSFAIKGTVGYVPPEYAEGGKVSCAGDVYSFGIVLLEVFLRKSPTDDMFKDGLNIPNFVEMNFPDRIFEIVDPQLKEEQHDDLAREASKTVRETNSTCLVSVLEIGLHCAKAHPSERMDMREAAARLHTIKDVYLRGNWGNAS
ncbi:hypothetical protein EJB05_28912, partial [Eragrostis curvula]